MLANVEFKAFADPPKNIQVWRGGGGGGDGGREGERRFVNCHHASDHSLHVSGHAPHGSARRESGLHARVPLG